LASRRAKSANLIMMVSDVDGGSNYTTDPQCGLGSGVNETPNFVLKIIASSATAA
jgi:tRNA U34 2-thiouridine synthase MnmA/TrmU